MECLLPYLRMVTVPHIVVGLERMLDYRGVGLARFHCTYVCMYVCTSGTRAIANTFLCTYVRTSHLYVQYYVDAVFILTYILRFHLCTYVRTLCIVL